MIKACKKLAIVLLLPFTLSGCWDYRDINRKSVNLSIGIDSVNNNIKFTSELAKVATSQKGKGKKIDVFKVTSDGPYFEGARYDFDTRINAPDFIAAVRTLVFGKNFAESIGIESYLNRMTFNTEFRTSTLLAICDNSAEELLKDKTNSDLSVGYAIENTVTYLSDLGRALHVSTLNAESSISMKTVGYFLPYITRDKDTIQYLGLAAMKNSKLVGIVKAEDSFGELFILSKKANMPLVIPHPRNEKNMVSLKAYIKKRNFKTDFRDGKVHINIDLKLYSELIYEYESQEINDKDKEYFDTVISNKVKSDILNALNRSTQVFKCDVFNFAKYFRAANTHIYENIDWEKEYLSAIFDVNVETTIKHTTLLDPNSKLPN